MPGPITQSPNSQGPLSPLLQHLLSSKPLPGQQQSLRDVGHDVTKNFGNYNIFQQLGNPNVQLPRTNFAEQTTQGIQNPLLRTAAQTVMGIPQSIANVPSDFQHGATQTVNDIGSGQITQPNKALADAASLVSPVATVMTMAPAAGVVKQGVGQAVGTGAKIGAGFGALGATQQNRNETNPVAYAENELKNIFLGGGLGAVLGGAGGLAGKAKGELDTAVKENPTIQKGGIDPLAPVSGVTPESVLAKIKGGTNLSHLTLEEKTVAMNLPSEQLNEANAGFAPGQRVVADRASDMHKETFGNTNAPVPPKNNGAEVQAREQRAKGLGLLADLDAATNKESMSTDPAVQKQAREEIRQVVVKIFSQPEGSPYDAYRKGLYSLMKMVKPFAEKTE